MARILIIDDDSNVIQQLTELVSSAGHESQSSLYPNYLFQILEARPVDLILLDVYMPGTDGLVLLKQLKAHETWRHLPVIMLTGDTDEKLLSDCFEAGAFDFINKPISEVALRARIKSALEVQSYISRLQKSNLQLKSIFDGMNEGVVTLGDKFQILMASSLACKMLGVSEEDVLGKPAAAVLGAPIAGPSGLLMQALENGLEETSSQLLCPGGAVRPVGLSITVLDGDLSESRWLISLSDRREEERRLRHSGESIRFGNMVSNDPKMREIFAVIDKIADSQAAVLIQGESGVGKELLAREIHNRGPRAQKPFYAINCGAIPANLMESEFFGHERGAFTGAVSAKPGHFENANGGTLFLDEVGEIPFELQVKLLRVLQEQRVQRVGGSRSLPINVRIVAATLKDLQAMVSQKQFREDLYYRLDVISIHAPPLRDRIQDVPLLVTWFLAELNRKEGRQVEGLRADALQLLLNYSWPGNIRELNNALARAFAVSSGNLLRKEHLPEKLRKPQSLEAPQTVARSEKETILHALEQTGFNKGRAAALLGISPPTLYRKRKKYGI